MTPTQRRALIKYHAIHQAAHTRFINHMNGVEKRTIAARTRAAEDMAAAAFQIVRVLHEAEKAAGK